MAMNQKDHSPLTWNTQNVFSGTARYYSRYRPGYPDEVFCLLENKFHLDRFSRVLDLGCGTGQISLPLAPKVREVVAIDPQEEMLEEAKSLAAAKGIKNIHWLLGDSKNLSSISDSIGKIDLTVIARAFHWMDKEQVLRDLYSLTEPGGGVAIIGDSELRAGLKTPWKEVINQVIRRCLGEERKAGTEGTYSHPTKRFEDFLKKSAYRNLETVTIQLERIWTVDQIVGYLFSTSYCSLPVLGNKKTNLRTN
jgi:ubiquinone/menaquinone biosynthesis C-methylase UbiE